MQRQQDIKLPACQKPGFRCTFSLWRAPQKGKPWEMDCVPLLLQALLTPLFRKGTQRLLTREGILASEADKLLLRVVMLWIFKGTPLHHFCHTLHDIKVKYSQTHISLYGCSPGSFFSLLFPHTEFKWGIKGFLLCPCGNNTTTDFLPTAVNIYLKVSYCHKTSTQNEANEKIYETVFMLYEPLFEQMATLQYRDKDWCRNKIPSYESKP